MPSFGILSTYPPTPCGLATFSAALADGLTARGTEVASCASPTATPPTTPNVVGELVNGSAPSVAAAVRAAEPERRRHHPARVRHLRRRRRRRGPRVLDGLRVPVDRGRPHRAQRSDAAPALGARAVAALADQVVVMSEAARERLCAGFDVDRDKVITIPHGAALPSDRRRAASRAGRPCSPGACSARARASSGSSTRWRRSQDLPDPPALPGRRPHPPEGARRRRRGVPRSARSRRRERLGVADSVTFDADYRDVAGADRAHPVAPPSSCCPTTRRTRSPRASSSTPSPAAARSSPPPSRTPSSCSAAAPASSSTTTTPTHWPRRCAGC